MKAVLLYIYIFFLSQVILSCDSGRVVYSILSNGETKFTIEPKDIEYYDTSMNRGYVEIHEIKLRHDFYSSDSILLISPIRLVCQIDGKEYFRAIHFPKAKSVPDLNVEFHFDPDCENEWKFSEGGSEGGFIGDTIILYTNNLCNSIELFHRKRRIEENRRSYFEKKEYFKNYVDTARLAHEILLDPYYLNALKANGVEIK